MFDIWCTVIYAWDHKGEYVFKAVCLMLHIVIQVILDC